MAGSRDCEADIHIVLLLGPYPLSQELDDSPQEPIGEVNIIKPRRAAVWSGEVLPSRFSTLSISLTLNMATIPAPHLHHEEPP